MIKSVVWNAARFVEFLLISCIGFTGSALRAEDRLQHENFSLGGNSYIFTLPNGYCVPSGAEADAATEVARLDERNLTHISIAPCSELGATGAYTTWAILKTPRESLRMRIPSRAKFVESMAEQLETSKAAPLFVDVSKLLGKNLADVFGADFTLGGEMEPIHADEYAGYLGGVITMSGGPFNGSVPVACIAAMTVVKGNVFFYYRYATFREAKDLGNLLHQVKPEIRAFIADNPD